MQSFLFWVRDKFEICGENYWDYETCEFSTESFFDNINNYDNQSCWYAINLNGTTKLEDVRINGVMMENRGDYLVLENGEFPEDPFLLTNDPSYKILFDGIVTLKPTDGLKRSLQVFQKPFSRAFKFGKHLGVLCSVNGYKLGYNRVVLFGKEMVSIPNKIDLHERSFIDEPLEYVGTVFINKDEAEINRIQEQHRIGTGERIWIKVQELLPVWCK